MILASGVPGCADPAAEPALLELSSFRQDGARSVCLNETLVFHFSADLDPASVTSRSVRIEGPGGTPAAGELRVRRSRIEFWPELPRRPDLSDGGLVPGVRYAVELSGFPHPDGVRSLSGEPLSSPRRASFRAVEPGGSVPLFLDPLTDQP